MMVCNSYAEIFYVFMSENRDDISPPVIFFSVKLQIYITCSFSSI